MGYTKLTAMVITAEIVQARCIQLLRKNRIGPQEYALALAFAFLCMVLDEIYKIRYRMILEQRKKDEADAMAQKGMNDRIEIVVDLLEKHQKLALDNSIDMRELKVHVGEIEKSVR